MNTESYRKAFSIVLGAAAALLLYAPPAFTQTILDFDFFKQRVAPIFLKQRDDHGRCYSCHQRWLYNQTQDGPAPGRHQYLEKLPEGADFWTDAQLRIMFERIATTLVVPGEPGRSMLVMHPLALEEGGAIAAWAFHSGGAQFADRHDPDRQTMVEWIRGATLGQ